MAHIYKLLTCPLECVYRHRKSDWCRHPKVTQYAESSPVLCDCVDIFPMNCPLITGVVEIPITMDEKKETPRTKTDDGTPLINLTRESCVYHSFQKKDNLHICTHDDNPDFKCNGPKCQWFELL